jgi:multidrug transporter EmrE-like cation transporter
VTVFGERIGAYDAVGIALIATGIVLLSRMA